MKEIEKERGDQEGKESKNRYRIKEGNRVKKRTRVGTHGSAMRVVHAPGPKTMQARLDPDRCLAQDRRL